jgi:hypothetical protein
MMLHRGTVLGGIRATHCLPEAAARYGSVVGEVRRLDHLLLAAVAPANPPVSAIPAQHCKHAEFEPGPINALLVAHGLILDVESPRVALPTAGSMS